MTSRHRLHGLLLESDVAIPAAPVSEATDSADVRLRVGGVPADQSQPLQGKCLLRLNIAGLGHYEAVEHADGSSTLRFHRVCDFVVEADNSTVGVQLAAGSDHQLLEVLVQGALIAYLLMRRGQAVLHASAIAVPDGCLAVIGRSGMGKSTLALGLVSAGHPLVTDDLLRVDTTPEGLRAHQGPSELRMRSPLRESGSFVLGTRTTADMRTAVLVPAASGGPFALRALVVPRIRPDAAAADIRRLHGSEAIAALLRFPRLPGVFDQGVLADQFRQCASFASRVPVYLVDVPRMSSSRLAPGRALAAALAQSGLAPAPTSPPRSVPGP